MDPILKIAADCGAMVIEDGAQSIGAEYKGRKAQSIGEIGCIRFFPSKNLGGFGDGGMVLTDDQALADKMASLRLHGTTKKYYHPYLGTNSRLDTLQAAVLLVKLSPGFLERGTSAQRREVPQHLGCGWLADRAAGGNALPDAACLQPVCHSLRAPRRTENLPSAARCWHRSLLSAAAAPSALLCRSGLWRRFDAGQRARQ